MFSDLRPADALKFLQEVSLDQVRDDQPDLTIRQMTILLTIYLETPPHTVRGLAGKLGVTKPVVTRALDTMGRMNLVSRRRDERDRRNVLVQRTVDGAIYLEKLSDLVLSHLKRTGE